MKHNLPKKPEVGEDKGNETKTNISQNESHQPLTSDNNMAFNN